MCKGDLNYALAYPTVKMVMVADWRLGLLRWSFLLATLVYILVYALFLQRGYLDIQSPRGSVTASLKRPQGIQFRATDFEYCNVSQSSSNYPDPLLCAVWPADLLLFPNTVNDYMMITTRVSELYLTLNPDCLYSRFGDGSAICNDSVSFVSNTTPKRYLAGIENYTIQITHAMLDTKHYELTGHEKYCLTGEQMDGALLDSDGNVLKRFPAEGPLRVTVNDLLQASDTRLRDLSDAVDNSGGTESMRHSGILLMAILNYDNTYGTRNRNPRYTLKVIRIKRAEYKVTETVTFNETYRMIRDRHGIAIAFVQGGTIGKFNFQTALISLAASLGLLGVSTLVVDSLMLYYCKNKENYYKEKYDVTERFTKGLKLKLAVSKHERLLNENESSRSTNAVQNDVENESDQPYFPLTEAQPG